MKQEVAQSFSLNIDTALTETVSQLTRPASAYNAVVFFAAPEYDFPQLSDKIKKIFPNAEVIGTSCASEFSVKGFCKKALVLTALSCTKTRFQGVLVENADKFPIVDKTKIEKAATAAGITIGSPYSHKDAFAFVFINGLHKIEESFLSLFYAIIKNDEFIIAGGSAGDDLQFKITYISYNGKTTTNGAVILFVKTQCAFDVRKINTFKPMGKRFTVTKADITGHVIHEIDGKNPKRYYCECIGIPESKADQFMYDYPLGRVFNDRIFISAIVGFTPSGSMNMFTRVLPNTVVELLQPTDTIQVLDKHLSNIKTVIPNPGCGFVVFCTVCEVEFTKFGICDKVTDLYKNTFPSFCGFSSFGEQLGKFNLNETIITITIGE